ncbi:FMN-binding protein [Paenibacillus taiwanensis]|uniref:FMN-binding protein n=1 Tax=Paenibacillus taiwanensis TaxID=401638 RepID=UPI00041134CD|nr:FMN-binding protein [Paenibacillus taiwanensis]
MKKAASWVALGLAAALLLSGCGGAGKYKDGTYEGTGRGASSDIKVAVTVKAGKIESIELKEHEETAQLIEAVKENTIPDIVTKQDTAGVEALTGATKSSEGVLAAVKQALEQAK